MTDLQLFRVYEQAGADGYPPEWHHCRTTVAGARPHGIKDIVREQAGNRCVRCGHPYIKGMGEWSPCDKLCTHDGPIRIARFDSVFDPTLPIPTLVNEGAMVAAQWRILTVHHLNGVKLDCRWWNLVPLCQRDHLTIQGKVKLEREFVREHSDWFKPYAAGWYAHRYLDENLTRAEVEERLDDLLHLELAQESLF